MPAPRDLLLLSGTPWAGPYRKAVVEVARRLAEHRRVVFVDFPETLASAVRQRRPGALRSRTERVDGVLRVAPPALLPHNGLPPGAAWEAVIAANRALYRRTVRAAAEALDPFVLVNVWNPVLGAGLAGKLGEELSVYWCYDEIGGVGWNARHGVAAERRLLGEVDGVIVTSPGLAAAKGALHPRVALVPNGVDVERFAPAADPAFPVDAALAGRAGPVLGFLGCVDHRVDVGLVAHVARAFPTATIALVGPVDADLSALARLPNVLVAGPASTERLAGVVRGFDVGLIPFVKSSFTAAIYPLKVNEYLAAGRPVVATDFAPLPGLEGEVRVASTPEGFVAAVRAALTEGEGRRAERMALARAASWERRTAEWALAVDRFADMRRAA